MSDRLNVVAGLLEKEGPREWEVFHQMSETFRVEVKGGVVDSLKRAKVSGLAVRVIDEGRVGFSFTAALDVESLERTVRTAVDSARFMPVDPDVDLAEPSAMPVMAEPILHPSLKQCPESDKTEIAAEIERLARSEDKRVTTIRTAGYADTIVEATLVNSRGLEAVGAAGFVRGWIELMAEANGDQEMAYWMEQARSTDGIDPRIVAVNAARRAVSSLGGRSVPSARLPVVVENTVAVDLLSVLAGSFVAENHFKKTASPKIQPGEAVFSDKVSIIDDGLETRGDGAFPFDGEGTPSSRTEVVVRGRVASLLFDRKYAGKFGTVSTGNCRRSTFEALPMSGPTNLFIEPGVESLEALFGSVGNGLFITELMGLHTADPISGDFSVGAAGFAIKGGMLDHPVKGVAIAGNIIDLFKNVRIVGTDFRFFGSLGASSLVVEGLAVSGL